MMNIFEHIKQELENMTKSEHKAAMFFLGHANYFALRSLDQIAFEIGTSTTTIIRFCRRLGFSGYKDFQESIRKEIICQPNLSDKLQRTMTNALNDNLLTQTVQRGIDCIEQTFEKLPFESLTAAVETIANAERVFTFGMRESYTLAYYAYTRFITVRPNSFILHAGYNGEIEALLSLTEKDVCVAFLFHRYTKQSPMILSALKKRGVPIILVTSAPYDAVEKYAHVILPCRVDASGVKGTALAPICLTDYLCNALSIRNSEASVQRMRQTESLFEEISVFGS